MKARVVSMLVVSLVLVTGARGSARAAKLPWVRVSADGRGFALDPGGGKFVPWGFNYDRDDRGRLLEDYWESEWPKVERDFTQMKAMGANVVRVHLQIGRFLGSPAKPRKEALVQLGRLVRLAERLGLYLDITGLGCYHQQDVPAWYSVLPEAGRWEAQAEFWRAVVARCKNSPAVFCYDLMNEPVVSGTTRRPGDWLAPPFGGECFVQFINLYPGNRPRSEIARAWLRQLVGAIRKEDSCHLVTVGMLDWNSNQPGALSAFTPDVVRPEVDYVSVHLYPESGKVEELVHAVKGYAVARPVMVEEMFPLRCSTRELEQFIDGTEGAAAGWIGFYWGKPPEELRKSHSIGDAITLAWLELFTRRVVQR